MRTENHVLRSNFFVSRYAKNSWKPLLCFRIFGISKTFMHITVFLRFFCLTISKNFLRSHLMFQKVSNVRYRIKFMQLNDMSRFSVENFPSQGDERFRWGTLWYIRKVRLSKNFMPMRLISLFSVEIFPRILPIKFVGEPLCVTESLGHRKLLCSVGGSRDFQLIFLASQYWQIACVTPSTFQKISGIETFYAPERKITFFSRIFLSNSTQNFSWKPLHCFRIFEISKTFMHITVFLRFFCLTLSKNFVRNHLMFQKVSNVRYRKLLCKRTE